MKELRASCCLVSERCASWCSLPPSNQTPSLQSLGQAGQIIAPQRLRLGSPAVRTCLPRRCGLTSGTDKPMIQIFQLRRTIMTKHSILIAATTCFMAFPPQHMRARRTMDPGTSFSSRKAGLAIPLTALRSM